MYACCCTLMKTSAVTFVPVHLRAGVIVHQRQRVGGTDEEVIVHTPVVVVMDDGRQESGEERPGGEGLRRL